MDRKKVTRRTALGMITGGAIMTATGTVAFSDISGSRSANLAVADDPNAYLSIENALNADEDTVFTNLTNLTVEVELTGNDSNFSNASPDSFTLEPDESQTVGVDGSAETVTVSIDATFLDGGSSLGGISLTRDFAVPQADQIELTPNVTGAGNRYEFEIENTGDVDVTIDGVRVDDTSEPQADYVGDAPDNAVFAHDGNSVVSENLTVGADSITTLDQTVDISQGETEEFSFRRFRRQDGNPQNMNGEEVTTTVRFTDGSTATVELVP